MNNQSQPSEPIYPHGQREEIFLPSPRVNKAQIVATWLLETLAKKARISLHDEKDGDDLKYRLVQELENGDAVVLGQMRIQG